MHSLSGNQRNCTNGVCAIILALLLLALTSLSHAGKPANVGVGELALIPAYCVDTEAFMHGPENSPTQSPRAAGWVSKMGRSFWTMHHYCWGLVNLNRLRFGRVETNDKKYLAKQIVNEYRFVIDHSTPDFIMLPEVWARIGEASLLAGDIGGAMDAYAKSRSIKSDYAPAYVQWAEFQMRNNQREEAKALVIEGLRNNPDSKPLLELYRKLGGNPASLTASPASRTKPVPAESSPEAKASGAGNTP